MQNASEITTITYWTRFLLPCRNKGASDPEDVSQWSREPSSEQVNKWSGFVG